MIIIFNPIKINSILFYLVKTYERILILFLCTIFLATLSTSNNSTLRSKSSSVPPTAPSNGRSHSASVAHHQPNNKANLTTTNTTNNTTNTQNINNNNSPPNQNNELNANISTTNNTSTTNNNDNNNIINMRQAKLSPSTLTIPNLKKSYKSPNIKVATYQRPKSQIIGGHKDPMTESIMMVADQLHPTTKGQDRNTTGESKYTRSKIN